VALEEVWGRVWGQRKGLGLENHSRLARGKVHFRGQHPVEIDGIHGIAVAASVNVAARRDAWVRPLKLQMQGFRSWISSGRHQPSVDY
jgi:hypothetical protein